MGAALVLVMTACSSTTASIDEAAEPAPTAADSTAAEPAPVSEVPIDSDTIDSDTLTGDDLAAEIPELLQFTADLVGGGTFDGAATAGKPTVFWFWAPT